MTTRILLLGNTGQVGWELNRSLLTLGELVALDYPEIDMSNPDSIRETVREVEPNLIVNATAYTNVDKAESEPELAMAINGTGVGILAEEAKRLKAALIHYSTDYLFDGTKGEPYSEEDEPNPINVYGETKLTGERAVQAVDGAYLIFRTSWVYSLRRPCFVTKVLKWAREQETLRIVDDQVSSPTWARTLAEATAQVIAQGRGEPVEYIQEKRGLYHLAGGGSCSRFEWAKAITAILLTDKGVKLQNIQPAKSNEFPTPAERPLNTFMSCCLFEKIFGLKIPFWEDVITIIEDYR
ncbi:dTDP-4-dehydrorhamnose reductase [bacterium]|nr:dTDP-4-dehydrorhamnose reductase [bacterium]